MKNIAHTGSGTLAGIHIPKIALMKINLILHIRKIDFAPCRQVVQDHHLVSPRREFAGEMGSDETRTAGHQIFAHGGNPSRQVRNPV